MIQSLFILSPTGEVLIERHFRGVTLRSVCDYFWEIASQNINHHGGLSTTSTIISPYDYNDSMMDSIPPIMEVPEGSGSDGTLYLFNVLRDGLSYLAVCPQEVSPLLIIEFLHRIADIFVDYFGNPADESSIKDNFSTVYQLLEEMIDNGYPLTTEPNALKAMIRPPTVMGKLQSVVTGMSSSTGSIVSDALPSGTISNMPWRSAGVKYTQNEIYVDIVEEIDAIIDDTGNVINADINGSIQVQSHLSGVPDLLLTFKDPSVIDDCSFHPCVRYGRYESDNVVSFVPPDGNFELMRYRVKDSLSQMFTPPIYCNTQWSYDTNNKSSKNTSTTTDTAAIDDNTAEDETTSGRIVLDIGVRSVSSLRFSASRKSAMSLDDVAVIIPFPKNTSSTKLNVNVGRVIYDEAGKVAKWDIGHVDTTKRPKLDGTMILDNTSTSSSSTSASSSSNNNNNIGSGLIFDNSNMNSSIYSNNIAELQRAMQQDNNSTSSKTTTTSKGRGIENRNVSLSWKIPLASVSGLNVSGLSITGESYRPYKGVRNITKSGRFQIRC